MAHVHSEVILRMESEVIGGKPGLTVRVRGIKHPLGVIAMCNAGITEALARMQTAEIESEMRVELANGVQRQ